MHLLLGHPEDPCCAAVLARLNAGGLPARIVASPLMPPAQLKWRLDAEGLASSLYLDVPDTRSPASWCATPAGSSLPAGTRPTTPTCRPSFAP